MDIDKHRRQRSETSGRIPLIRVCDVCCRHVPLNVTSSRKTRLTEDQTVFSWISLFHVFIFINRPLILQNWRNMFTEDAHISRGYSQKAVSAYALHRRLRPSGSNPSIYELYFLKLSITFFLYLATCLSFVNIIMFSQTLVSQKLFRIWHISYSYLYFPLNCVF